jgi:molybdopterin synthase catalytic subunit
LLSCLLLQEVEKQVYMSKYLHEGAIPPALISKEIANLSQRKNTGAHSIFLGQVRADIIDNKRVKQIDYSAYDELVNVEAEKLKRLSVLSSLMFWK